MPSCPSGLFYRILTIIATPRHIKIKKTNQWRALPKEIRSTKKVSCREPFTMTVSTPYLNSTK